MNILTILVNFIIKISVQNKRFHLHKESIIKLKIKGIWLYCIKPNNDIKLFSINKLKFFTIIGSRRITLSQINKSKAKLTSLLRVKKKAIVSGGARGSDTLAEYFAYKHNIFFIKILSALYINTIPNFIEESKPNSLTCSPKLCIKSLQIKYALLYRNKILSRLADFVISLATPKQSGTSYTLLYSLLANKPIYFIKNRTNNNGANFLYKHNIGMFY